MADSQQPLGASRLPGLQPVPPRSKDALLLFCRFLNVLTALSSILCAAAFGMALVLRGNAPDKDAYFISGQMVRLFGIIGSLLLILVETEWHFVLKLVPLLDIWVARGLTHLFIAALTFREAYPADDLTDFQKSLQLYRTVSSGLMAGCAVVYMMGGVCCIGALRRMKERREERIHDEWEELERRRRELQRLLGRQVEP